MADVVPTSSPSLYTLYEDAASFAVQLNATSPLNPVAERSVGKIQLNPSPSQTPQSSTTAVPSHVPAQSSAAVPPHVPAQSATKSSTEIATVAEVLPSAGVVAKKFVPSQFG